MISGAYVTAAGSPGPFGEEHAVRLALQHLLGRRLRRHDRHSAPVLREQPQDVALDPVVVRDDVRRRVRIAPRVRARASRRATRGRAPPSTGTRRARPCVSAEGVSPAPITPRMTPADLRCRVRRRVSTSSRIGTCASREPAPRSPLARQFEYVRESSRTTTPATCGCADSGSSRVHAVVADHRRGHDHDLIADTTDR